MATSFLATALMITLCGIPASRRRSAKDLRLWMGAPDGATARPLGAAAESGLAGIFAGILGLVDRIVQDMNELIVRSVPNEGSGGGGSGSGDGDEGGSKPPAKEPRPIGKIEHPDGSTEIIWDPPSTDGPLTTGEIQPDPLPTEQPEAPIWWRIINVLGGGEDL